MNAPASAWVGCQDCDCSFPCYNGEVRCIRLPLQAQEPLPPQLPPDTEVDYFDEMTSEWSRL